MAWLVQPYRQERYTSSLALSSPSLGAQGVHTFAVAIGNAFLVDLVQTASVTSLPIPIGFSLIPVTLPL
jgi:hypothetical protein